MFIAAALLLPLALQASPALTGNGNARFQACTALIESDPARAYEEGMAWAAESLEVGGYRCAAMALVAQDGRAADGARRFESLAESLNPEATGLKAELLSQAGNAWLLAYNAQQARVALTNAITLMQADPTQLPDLLIDRARAYAMARDYRHAEEDLSRALDIRPNDGLALRLRADARMRQNSFDLAEADALAAVNLEPTSVDALLMLGHTREAKRTGAPVQQ